MYENGKTFIIEIHSSSWRVNCELTQVYLQYNIYVRIFFVYFTWIQLLIIIKSPKSLKQATLVNLSLYALSFFLNFLLLFQWTFSFNCVFYAAEYFTQFQREFPATFFCSTIRSSNLELINGNAYYIQHNFSINHSIDFKTQNEKFQLINSIFELPKYAMNLQENHFISLFLSWMNLNGGF